MIEKNEEVFIRDELLALMESAQCYFPDDRGDGVFNM